MCRVSKKETLTVLKNFTGIVVTITTVTDTDSLTQCEGSIIYAKDVDFSPSEKGNLALAVLQPGHGDNGEIARLPSLIPGPLCSPVIPSADCHKERM